jgi:hypothetical protein
MGNTTQHIRQASTQNGTIFQQPVTSGIMTTPTSIVRVNQPQNIQQTIQNHGQFVPQTLWTNNIPQSPQNQFTLQKQTQPSSVLQYATIKNGKRNFFLSVFSLIYLFRTDCTWWNATTTTTIICNSN